MENTHQDFNNNSRVSGKNMGVEEFSTPKWTARINKQFILAICAGSLIVIMTFSAMWYAVAYQPDLLTTVRSPRYVSRLTNTEEKQISGWEIYKSRDAKNYINPFEDTTIISGREICENPNTTMVIICTSRTSDFFKRAAVRATWGSHNVSTVKIGFLLGMAPNGSVQMSIEKESEQYGDIIQENLADTYMNLSLKSIALLKWYIRWCPLYSILVKADDDSFIDVKMLVNSLDHHRPLRNVVGYINQKYEAIRNPSDKYYVPRYIYEDEFIPEYVGGPGYFMDRDAAVKLYTAALDTPIFPFEDVYIAGFCAQKANITLRHFKWASFWERDGINEFDKKCLPLHVFCHPLKEREMAALWRMRNKILTKSTRNHKKS